MNAPDLLIFGLLCVGLGVVGGVGLLVMAEILSEGDDEGGNAE